MLKIGLTGGIASGKTLVSQYFSELGIDIIDADQIARDLFNPESAHLKSLTEHFGNHILDQNNKLDRKALAKTVFSDLKQLKWLNELTHPLVNEEMKRQLDKVKSKYVILDIPLLIEKGSNIPPRLSPFIDRVLVVNTKIETQFKRIADRDKRTKGEAFAIINSQSSLQEKLALADDVIDNNQSKQFVKEQVIKLNKLYSSL